jgi:hypothetical protein
MLLLWVALFGIVAMQMTTFVRPVLWRDPGAPIVAAERMFFLHHLGRVHDRSDRPRQESPGQSYGGQPSQ